MTRFASARFVAAGILAAAVTALAAEAPPPSDPEGAAKQYRIARRLAAEGSPDAAAALGKVFELDPTGPLADDALVEQALLLPVASWPGDLGRISATEAERAETLLGRVIDGLPSGDRANEARVFRALLLLEPLPGREPARARLDLLAVTSGAADERWRTAARYGIAWIDERVGERERARSAFQRLAIDDPSTPAGIRARAGLARLLLREGKPGRAAALLNEVVDSGADAGRETTALRDLAVRTLQRRERVGGRWGGGTVATSQSGLKGIGAAARLRDGGLLIADRRDGVVLEIGPEGATGARVTLPDGVQALAEDPMGRRFAAAGEKIYRLLPTGASPVAQLGDFAPVSAMAADGWGRLWVLDKKGDKLGVLEPGAPSPSALAGTSRSVRLTGLAWDGVRLVSLDSKSKWIVEVMADGNVRPSASVPCERPEMLAADPAGEVAVLDDKTDEVLLVGPDGEVRDRLPIKSAGLERADLIVLGADGSLDLLVEGNGVMARFP